ncbi:MAG: hypothetical protein U9Q17_02120 [Chloroflexota bacterium]|nr:hypothetical protein [Chloroflexota bacterium]
MARYFSWALPGYQARYRAWQVEMRGLREVDVDNKEHCYATRQEADN